MNRLLDLSKKAAEKIKSFDKMIHIIAHYDVDGISSVAIIISALLQLDKKFHLSIVKRIKSEFIEELKKREPELVMFVDIGSGYLDEIEKLSCDIIISDHHEIVKEFNSEKLIHINPELFGISNISGSCVTYLIAKELSQNNTLAPLALLGAIGDSANTDLDIFKESPLLKKEMGLKLFGRSSRPIHKALELSSDFFIPDVTGDESKAIQFLAEIGIKSREGNKWRTLNDLNNEELQKLHDAIIKERFNHLGKEEIFGDVWTLKNFPSELQDAKEFSTIINACSRMGDPATGIAVCLGNKNSLETMRGLMKGYRRLINNYMRWLEENPENIRKTEHSIYILGGSFIHENLIGTIASILSRTFDRNFVVGLTNAEDGIKISARSTEKININKIIRESAIACNGIGGGHREAAGATIPYGNEEKFIEICDKLIENSIKQKDL